MKTRTKAEFDAILASNAAARDARAKEQAEFQALSAAAAKRREAFKRGEPLEVVIPPTLDSIYSQSEALRKAEETKERHKKALIEATRPLTDFELQHMPPTDARVLEWKKRAINRDYYAALEAAALEAITDA